MGPHDAVQPPPTVLTRSARAQMGLSLSIWAHTSISRSRREQLLQCRRNKEFLRRRIVLHAQHIGLAADLAVFDVALPVPRGFVHGRYIPLATTRTLKASFHENDYLTASALGFLP